jgi:hypothetical protein
VASPEEHVRERDVAEEEKEHDESTEKIMYQYWKNGGCRGTRLGRVIMRCAIE